MNPGQKYLWQCWEHACANIGPVHALVINGDAIDGMQQAQRSSELCLSVVEDQAEAAYLIIKKLWESVWRPPIYCIAGTEYHDQTAGREMEVLAQRLGAQQYSGIGIGRYCKEAIDMEVCDAIINISHGTSVSSGLYRATPPDREAVWSALAGKQGKAPKADVVIRSHAHHFVHVEHPSKHAVITPCWQLQTRYMRKYSMYRMLPDIGYVIIEIDPVAKRNGDDPCVIRKKLYPLPEPRITSVHLPGRTGSYGNGSRLKTRSTPSQKGRSR
ncbi:MAG: hypothetical protein N3A02_01430 [Rectinema sp.]|nr:hypothetical protein [Rectinema sp.]